MDRTQKRILWLLLAIGAIYFVAFIFPNATGAKTYSMVSVFSPDEHIQYPTPLYMLSGGSLRHALHKFILYGDYSYGFPFYGSSALVLLPLKLMNALNSQNVQLALLLLRQLISVLPMILAILLMVYTQTKFRSSLTSIVTFIFLLLIAAVVENDLWWHADSLTVLFVVLVFFFLDRDELKFGINFQLAAVACGLATGTKVLGLFFFNNSRLHLDRHPTKTDFMEAGVSRCAGIRCCASSRNRCQRSVPFDLKRTPADVVAHRPH